MTQTKMHTFQAGGPVNISDGMNASLNNPIDNDLGSTTTLNQEYNKQVENGSFKGSFADFMKHLSVNKIIDTGYNLTDSVRKLFAKTAGQTVTEPIIIEEPASSMKDMTKWIIGLGVATLVIWGGVVIYKQFKKQ